MYRLNAHGAHFVTWYEANSLVGTENTYELASLLAPRTHLIKLLERELLRLPHEKEGEAERQHVCAGVKAYSTSTDVSEDSVRVHFIVAHQTFQAHPVSSTGKGTS
jgi:hypothetical protein